MPPPDPVQLLRQGLDHQQRGELNQAEANYRQVLALHPNHPKALHLLGFLLGQKGGLEAAVELVRRAIAIDPADPTMYNNLGVWLGELRRFDEAVAAQRQSIRLVPASAIAHFNLAEALKGGGALDEALGELREALRLNPDQAFIHSNLVFLLQYHPRFDAAALRAELRRWREKFADPLKAEIRPQANDRSPERRLRVGYVSPDFRDHCQSLFTIPLLAHHDHTALEIFCYAGVARPDAATGRIAGYADLWRDVRPLDDAALCALIRADRIDILVDLTMHMAGGRPLVFARKPAPIQITWLAYPGSTGISAIDYRLTDPYLDPPNEDVDEMYVEKSIRLPATFWCYDPLENPPPAVGPLPALTRGHVTFGSLNECFKVNEGVLKLWARVLAGVAGSRLVLLADEGSHRERTLGVLEGLGVSRQRVSFFAKRPRGRYLELYHQIDIGLDTLPYNGHTTSLDSYFMGVPVVTLVGNTVVGRAGLSQLTNLGLPELIARTPDEYVRIARQLASNLERLAGLRAALRGRMRASPLMDAAAFARGIEAAYRQMWRHWCATA